MTIQNCIKLICQANNWDYKGSFMQDHPTTPASCGGGGGHRERRYEFSLAGANQTISFNTKQVRSRAQVIVSLERGDKWAKALYA